MNMRQLEKEVPFDQFSRQFQVKSILNQLRSRNQTFTILDVGGYKGRTADFLNTDKVTILDLDEVPDENYVQGSALAMPFEDESFDYVVSFDVLEHIPADKRKIFLNECNRVTKLGLIICAPHKTPANESAEISLNNLYKSLHKKPHRWLKEHIAYGIPDFKAVEKQANKLGLKTVVFHSNKVQLWTSMQQAIFINSKFSFGSEQLVEVNEFYNQHFKYDGGGTREAAYRLILCGLKSKKQKQLLEKLGLHNDPINPALEISLYEKIGKFSSTLVEKTNNLAGNYKDLYEHEKKRADTLQTNNESLTRSVSIKLKQRVSRKLKPLRKTTKEA